MRNGLLAQLDSWRERRKIWSRNDAVLQLVRFVVSQPWPLGNGPQLDANGNPQPDAVRMYPIHRWSERHGRLLPPESHPVLQLLIDRELLAELDEWRNERQIWSRADAIRQIVHYAVHQPPPGGNGPPNSALCKRIARAAEERAIVRDYRPSLEIRR